MPLTPHACLQLRAGYPSDTFSVIKGYLITLTVARAWHMSSTVLVAQAGGTEFATRYCAKMLFVLFISA